MKTVQEIKDYIDNFLENDKPYRRFNEFQRGYITAFRDLQGVLEEEEEK